MDQKIHQEVKLRFERLNIAPYAGFVNPQLTPVFEGNEITDVMISYNEDYSSQMIRYSTQQSFLDVVNV